MSGFVSALSTAAEAITGIVSLAFGALGGVVLGDFVFFGFEVPEQITFGTRQAMTVHKLPGGERVIDLMGPDPIDIAWSGTFIDGLPHLRAQVLNAMAASGEAQPLVWGSFFYSVVIKEFSAETKYSQAPYRIACTVIRDEASAALAADPDLTTGVGDDLGSAAAIAPSALTGSVVTAQTTVAGIGALIPGSSGIVSARSAVAVAQAAFLAQQVTAEAAIASGGIGIAPDITSLTVQAANLAGTLGAGGYLGRAARNLI